MEVCEASEYLDLLNARPEVDGGRIVELNLHPNENWEEPVPISAEQCERLGLDPNDLGCVEAHPEGSDRGGYVPTLSNGCYFMENDGEWHG